MICPDRYANEPRKRNAYCEAYDLITVYGVTEIKSWNCKHNVTAREKRNIWRNAKADAQGKTEINFIYEYKEDIMTMMNVINNAIATENFYIVEIVGSREYPVTALDAFHVREVAEEAKRRMKRRDGGKYVVRKAA